MSFQSSVHLSDQSRVQWEHAPTLFSHNLADCDLFQDEALIELLDSMPRENLFALNMGHDLLRPSENRLALHDGVSGGELLRAVKTGRLWLNVTRINLFANRYNAIVGELYEQIMSQVPSFRADVTAVTVLISSPRALVYYHVDGPANLLWHIRGEKQICVYPPQERYISRIDLENIFADAAHEYIPFKHEFDAAATVYDLKPGMAAGWQPNSPHRVTNGDSFNVSLSTEHYTAAHRRKARVYKANRFLRLKAGLTNTSTNPDGLGAMTKQLIYSVADKTGMMPKGPRKRHVPALRVVPDAPGGVVPL